MLRGLLVAGIAVLAFIGCGGNGGGGPEDAVQGMFDAVKAGDLDAMAEYMPAEARAEFDSMSADDREMARNMLGMLREIEFEILGSEVDGNQAVVHVSVTFMGDSQEDDIELIKEDNKWVITEGGMF